MRRTAGLQYDIGAKNLSAMTGWNFENVGAIWNGVPGAAGVRRMLSQPDLLKSCGRDDRGASGRQDRSGFSQVPGVESLGEGVVDLS
jgi:hypothetical protein